MTSKYEFRVCVTEGDPARCYDGGEYYEYTRYYLVGGKFVLRFYESSAVFNMCERCGIYNRSVFCTHCRGEIEVECVF